MSVWAPQTSHLHTTGVYVTPWPVMLPRRRSHWLGIILVFIRWRFDFSWVQRIFFHLSAAEFESSLHWNRSAQWRSDIQVKQQWENTFLRGATRHVWGEVEGRGGCYFLSVLERQKLNYSNYNGLNNHRNSTREARGAWIRVLHSLADKRCWFQSDWGYESGGERCRNKCLNPQPN